MQSHKKEDVIGMLISKLFYAGKLKNGRNYESDNSLVWIDYIPSRHWPDQKDNSNNKPRIRNLDECRIIIEILNEISAKAERKTEVAIIVPYRQQVLELKNSVGEYVNLRINIDTVDGFQGKEADVVIFGITRTSGPFRFLADNRRLNVALSRAKNQIYIVGNKQYAVKHQLLADIIEACTTIVKDLAVIDGA